MDQTPSWAYLRLRVFIPCTHLMSSSFNFFLCYVHWSCVLARTSPSSWSNLSWPRPPGEDEMAVCDVTPPSCGAGIQPAQPAQVSCLLTCDDLLPVDSYF